MRTFSHLLAKNKSQGSSFDHKKSTLAQICFKESENKLEQELLRVNIEVIHSFKMFSESEPVSANV